MLYEGKAIQASVNDDGIVELVFDSQYDKINKFDKITLDDLRAAVDIIKETDGIKGLISYSKKDKYIVGADITEFGAHFQKSEEEMVAWLGWCNQIFSDIEDLPYPTLTAVNGIALGGGCEMALSTDYRIIDPKGTIGLPEIGLGIMPGFGGTVRLPRLIGVDNALEIIPAGKSIKADAALKKHLVDAVVPADKLVDTGMKMLKQAIDGKLNWKERADRKKAKLKLPFMEANLVFQSALGMTRAKSKGYLAPVEAIKAIQTAAGMSRDKALVVEAKGFAKLAKSSVAQSLTGLFLSGEYIKRKAKKQASAGQPVKKAAVLGAGIMGGGIAYTSASAGIPIIMKDIRQEGLNQGMSEAAKLTSKLVKIGKIDETKMAATLANITPTLAYGQEDFGSVDIVVEAVTENPKIKKIVLKQVEAAVAKNTVITTNTSSISIDFLADALDKPENFCGMHFFNPVHRMQLVEIIRGEKSSDHAIGTAVAYASQMKKIPIVVRDCPGFLVNRVLFPYFAGFQMLVSEGVDFLAIDKAMEKFGWPMGPAYLLDVVGMDTAHHAGAVMAEGYPDRMKPESRTSLDIMVELDRYGQKTNKGFYSYSIDRKGKPKKAIDPEVHELLKEVQPNGAKEMSEEEIQLRMMLPMMIETIRCLEENIVDTPNEADTALIYGIGFPPFLGGALKYTDFRGLNTICALADKYSHLGKLYEPTQKMRDMAASGQKYYRQ